MGRSPDGSGFRATHEADKSSSPKASIPNAGWESFKLASAVALGGCVFLALIWVWVELCLMMPKPLGYIIYASPLFLLIWLLFYNIIKEEGQ